MNRTVWVAAATTIALTITACSGGDDAAPTTEPSPTTSEAVEVTSTTEAPTTTAPPTTVVDVATVPTTIPDIPRMPLTGVPIDDPSEVPDRPALIVKITNAGPQPLPQAGLNSADIVIEEVINDQVSRLAAVFHSEEADPVGPIRSGRAQDVNILRAFNQPLFAWSGGNPAVTSAIRDSDLVNLDARFTPGYYRRSGRSSPNNLYSSTEALWSQAGDDAGRPTTVFPYLRPGEVLTGDPATTIDIVFDSIDVRWTYDEASGRYFREQDGDVHNTETADGVEQVWTTNIVVMLADYGVNVFDGNPDAQTQGSNPVYVFTGGTVRVGTWLRFDQTDPIGIFDNINDLNELRLQPGRTWLEVPRNADGSVVYE